MTDIDVDNIIKVIADKVKSKVDLQQLNFQKQGLATQSEKAIYDVICEMANVGVIPAYEDVIYDDKSHQFPDIVIDFKSGYKLGIEVKSSSSSNSGWVINGNSVLGSTRVDVDDIFIIFIKFNPSDGFYIRYARYQDSIADVVVTHSPRYKIDLDVAPHDSFFHKSGISYEEINNSNNPIGLITHYYRSKGKTAWWLGDSYEEGSSSATILSWSDIDLQLEDRIYGQAFVLFPEIINGLARNKYNGLAKWLVAKYSIADSSLRDKFSAGGKITLIYENEVGESIYLEDIPHVYGTLTNHFNSIALAFCELDLYELQEFWPEYNPQADDVESRKRYWFSLFKVNEKSKDLLSYIRHLFKIDIP